MKTSDYEPYRILGMMLNVNIVHISRITCSGKRTVSHNKFEEMDKMVLEKVLSDERTTAYVTSIGEINDQWLNCKECNWFKSKQTILSEASLEIKKN